MQNAMLILSQDTQERITQNRSCDKSFSFDFFFCRSLALLSRSLVLFFSTSLSFTQSLPLSNSIYPLSLTPSLLLTFSLFPFLSLSHFLSFLPHPARSDSLHLSLLFSLNLFLSLFSDPLTHSIRLTSCLLYNTSIYCTICEQIAHNIITEKGRKQQKTWAPTTLRAQLHNIITQNDRGFPPTCMINFLKLFIDKTKVTPASTKTEQLQRQNCPCRGEGDPPPRTCHYVPPNQHCQFLRTLL